MPIISYFGMLFEWHDSKFELVNLERGYSLEEIASVFDDDYSVTNEDDGDYDEQRLVTTGMSNQFRMVSVVWVERGTTARIITAFKPSVNQQKRYDYGRCTQRY